MAGALLGIALLAQAGLPDKMYPDQMIGLMPRFGGGMLVGNGTDKVANPIFGFGGSLQFRLLEGLYLEISGDTRIPGGAKAPEGGILMGLDQQFVGLRMRRPLSPKSNLVFGAGGGAFAFVEYGDDGQKALDAGPAAHAFAGWEKLVVPSQGSGSYVGFELAWSHYFPTEKSPIHGGYVDARVTFSYYFGGSDAADCM